MMGNPNILLIPFQTGPKLFRLRQRARVRASLRIPQVRSELAIPINLS